MNQIIFNNYNSFFTKFKGIFSFDIAANHLYSNNIAILILLSHYKAKEWPRSGVSLDRDGTYQIPIIWANFHANKDLEILMDYSIHPTKCFPQQYNNVNQNAHKYPLRIGKYKNEILGGCGADVHISGNRYSSCEKTTQYCTAFGIPDDCFEKKFERKMIDLLQSYKSLSIWCFDRTEYIEDHIEPFINMNYMQERFLPTENFFYVDRAGNFLRGLFKTRDLDTINKEIWFPSGGEYFGEMEISNSISQIYEEDSQTRIIKKMVYEFVRQALLLMNKDLIKSSYTLLESSKYHLDEKAKIEKHLDSVIKSVEDESTKYLNSLISTIKNSIKYNLFKKTRFLVLDIEHTIIEYFSESNSTSLRNFPSVISNIVWHGPRIGFTSHINVLFLPCNICKKKPCDTFNKPAIKLNCLHFAKEFVIKQKMLLENLLSKYENFKVYSYGQSDINEIESALNFITKSSDHVKFERKKRKTSKRIIEVFNDLAENEIPLLEIEEKILSKWLNEWKRNHPYIRKKNQHFMRRLDDLERWKEGYLELLRTCTPDTISSLLYLLYKNFRIDKKQIKLNQIYPNLNDFL